MVRKLYLRRIDQFCLVGVEFTVVIFKGGRDYVFTVNCVVSLYLTVIYCIVTERKVIYIDRYSFGELP